MSPLHDFTADFQLGTIQQICDDDDDSDIELQKEKARNHRRSLVLMEQSLLVPCDQSPIAPETLRQQEYSSNGSAMERLMLERLLLRKELRLRSMQERLLEQDARIQELEARLGDIESSPGFKAFYILSGYCRNTADGTIMAVDKVKLGFWWTLAFLYQALVCLFDLFPPYISLGVAALIQTAGNLVAQRAENFSNEVAEREEWENAKAAVDRRKGRGDRRRR